MFDSVPLRTPQELAMMREAGRIVARVLDLFRERVRPGIRTIELDAAADALIRDAGGRPAFKGYGPPARPPFPASICASVNDEVVHGIPADRVLVAGDIISLDVGVEYSGFYADAACTLPAGPVGPKAEKLMRVCAEALELAIGEMKPGNVLFKIGQTVQRHVEANGFSVVRDFVGHGIGTAMHQPPEVPNYAARHCPDVTFRPGLVLAIEPMINAGGYRVKVDPNAWTVRTADGRLSAHFEHTVAVTLDGHDILTRP